MPYAENPSYPIGKLKAEAFQRSFSLSSGHTPDLEPGDPREVISAYQDCAVYFGYPQAHEDGEPKPTMDEGDR